MTSDLDLELEPCEEVIGNLDFSILVGSRSISPYWISTTSFQEPIHQLIKLVDNWQRYGQE